MGSNSPSPSGNARGLATQAGHVVTPATTASAATVGPVGPVGPEKLALREVIDNRPMSKVGFLTMGLCLAVAMLDGYDAQTIGFLTSSMSTTLGIPLTEFGPVLTAGLVGSMLGAITLGSLADRVGRKRILIISTLVMGFFTLLTAFATTVPMLLAVRFMAGVGLGSAMPNMLSMPTEFAPRKRLRLIVPVMGCGMPFGTVVGGLLSAALLKSHGWQFVYLVGGIIPLAVAVVLMLWLPESVKYLLTKNPQDPRIARTMLRIAPDLVGRNLQFVDQDERKKGAPVRYLFNEGRAKKTLLLWVPNFMNVMVIYFITSWLPSVLVLSGHDAQVGVLAITAFSLGGIGGGLMQGVVMHKFGVVRTLCTEFALFIVLVVIFSTLPLTSSLIIGVTFFTGLMVQGAQAGLNTLAAETYPLAVRSTGMGWAVFAGRIGSITAPIAGAFMLGLGWNAQHVFSTGVIPGAIAALAVFIGFGTFRASRQAGGSMPDAGGRDGAAVASGENPADQSR